MENNHLIKVKQSPIPIRTLVSVFLLFLSSIGIIWAIYLILPVGQDWLPIRSTALDMLAGHDPFSQTAYNPPWIFLLLIPLALLPYKLGAAILSYLNLAIFGIVALRFSKSVWIAALLLITPSLLRLIIDPNLEFLVALGLLLPPRIGIFLILAKPQLGAPVALFWIVETWRQGGCGKFSKYSFRLSSLCW